MSRIGSMAAMALAGVLSAVASARGAAKFQPPDGKVLLIVGQNLEDIADYVKAAKSVPGGLMSYTSLAQREGLSQPFNQGDGTQDAGRLVRDYPDTVLQIGLWMVGECEAIAHGDEDGAIDALAGWIASTRRPVFLRLGYEFDGPQNHYPPEAYVAAFRRIVDIFRRRHVENAAFVWHSFGGPAAHPLDAWYPGDSYVDWVGLSYFNQPAAQMKPVIEAARRHGKPVMIAESSPWHVQTRYANSWSLWFAPYFRFIADNGIQAISYIGADWDHEKQFASQHWGDTRLTINPSLLRRWLAETSQDRYLKASPGLYHRLGWDPPAP